MTQRALAAKARPSDSGPTGYVAVTVRVPGSIRLTVPSRKLLAQIAPPPAARRSGVSPTATVAATLPVAGSMARTLSALDAATHSRPPAEARPTGAEASGTQWRRLAGPSRGAVGPALTGGCGLLELPQAARPSTATAATSARFTSA